MSAHAQARQPAGVPVGGQFAVNAQAEPNLSLVTERPPLRETSRGVWEVVNATTEDRSADGDVVRSLAVHMGGIAHRRAESGMVALRMQRADAFDEYPPELRQLAEDGSKVTALVRLPNGDVEAREGTVFLNGESIGLVNKGDRFGKGIWLYDPRRRTGVKVLAVARGYGAQQPLADQYRSCAAESRSLGPATFGDIPEWDGNGEPPSEIAAVYVLNHPGFDGDQDGRGSVFFVTDFQPGDGSPGCGGAGIVNGYGVYAAGSGLESEHGSMYASDLARFGGRVKGYKAGSHTFRQVMGLAKVADRDDDIEHVWESVRHATS